MVHLNCTLEDFRNFVCNYLEAKTFGGLNPHQKVVVMAAPFFLNWGKGGLILAAAAKKKGSIKFSVFICFNTGFIDLMVQSSVALLTEKFFAKLELNFSLEILCKTNFSF